VMLITAAVAETLSAPAAGIGTGPGWRAVFVVLILMLLASRSAYRPAIGSRYLDGVRTILSVTAFAAMLITCTRLVFSDQPDLAEEAIRSWLFASVYLAAGKAGLIVAIERSNRLRDAGAPTLILGSGRVGHLVARRLLAQPELGLKPIGFLDVSPLEVGSESSNLPVLGSNEDLERVIRAQRIEHAIISFSRASHEEELRLSRTLDRMKVSVSIVPRLFEGIPDSITLDRVGGLPLMTIHPSNPRDWRVSMKYSSDRVLSALAILILSPWLLLGVVGTALTLGFPVLFRQRRIGLDGREFVMLKFRTLPGVPEEHGEANAEWAAQAAGGDWQGQAGPPASASPPRKASGFGGLMRRSGLDELPQLFNVLRGQMSMVGPRPEQVPYVAMFQDRVRRYDDRHRVKAGITGWAQVHGLRGDTSLQDRVEWDNYYIENWSPWLDVKILLLTIVTTLRKPPQ